MYFLLPWWLRIPVLFFSALLENDTQLNGFFFLISSQIGYTVVHPNHIVLLRNKEKLSVAVKTFG